MEGHPLHKNLSKLKIFDGPLYNMGIFGVDIESAGTPNEKVNFEWTLNAGDGDKDLAFPIIYDEVSDSVLFAKTTRDAQAFSISTGILRPLDPVKTHAYLVFVRPPTEGTSETGQVSATAYSIVKP